MRADPTSRAVARYDWPGIGFAVLFAAMGILAALEADEMSLLGSIFPRTIGMAMAAFAICYIAYAFLQPRSRDAADGTGSWTRRIALTLIMLVWIALLPWLGFIVASILGFFGMVLTGNYDRWDTKRVALYAATSAGLIGGFYLLFAIVLNVPLPEARLF
jgi:putative tricarboxylic transport membrane protein